MYTLLKKISMKCGKCPLSSKLRIPFNMPYFHMVSYTFCKSERRETTCSLLTTASPIKVMIYKLIYGAQAFTKTTLNISWNIICFNEPQEAFINYPLGFTSTACKVIIGICAVLSFKSLEWEWL